MRNKNKIALLLALNILLFPSCKDTSNNDVIENDNDKTIEDNNYIEEPHDQLNNVFSLEDEEIVIKEENSVDYLENSNDTPNNYNMESAKAHLKDYYNIFEEQDISIYKMAYILEDVMLYNSVTYEYDLEIEKYQKVIILEENEDWSLIQTEGEFITFIENDKIEILPDTFVEVDISEQNMNLYKDGEIILSSPTVTGSNKHCTDLCYGSIYQKKRNTYLTGPTWKSYVNYWMAFNRSMGLHDALWRTEFGKEIYKENGSHGCVNLPLEAAEELYNNVEIGTRVLVHK